MWVVRAVADKSETSGWRGGAMIAIVVSMGLMLVFASYSAMQSARERNSAQIELVRTLDIINHGRDVEIGVLSALRGERGYLLTDDPLFLRPFGQGRSLSKSALTALQKETSDNPLQQQRLATLAVDLEEYLAMLSELTDLQSGGRHDEAIKRERDGEGRRAVEAIMKQIEAIDATERGLLAQRSAVAALKARSNERFQYVLTSIGLLLLATAIAAAFAVRRAVENEAAVRAELRRIAQTDELTGLANRRELLAGLERAIASSRRTNRSLGFAILDIDHFKRVNDTYGHPVGDEVIRKVAELAVKEMRGQDIVGRLGGEEFAIVLPECSPGDAFAACERLRMRVQSARIRLDDGQEVSVTLSTGIAGFERGDTLDQLMNRADAALYRAKNCGRDQVLLAA